MGWEKVKKILGQSDHELIEVYFHGMSKEAWTQLFDWASDKLIVVDCHHGRLEKSEFKLDPFLNDEMFYSIDARMPNNEVLVLGILDQAELTIDVEKCEIDTEESFTSFLKNIELIAQISGCEDYIICPEFKKGEAFIHNGQYC